MQAMNSAKAYRCAAKFADAVYVLHCFQKKSTSGIATPKPDLDLIATRFRMAREFSREALATLRKKR